MLSYPAAFAYDWLTRFHTTFKPLRLTELLDGSRARANCSWLSAWLLTVEILKDRSSHLFAAAAGWEYAPAPAEQALWDYLDAGKRLRKRGWRPWADPRSRLFNKTHGRHELSEKQQLEREKLKKAFHIQD